MVFQLMQTNLACVLTSLTSLTLLDLAWPPWPNLRKINNLYYNVRRGRPILIQYQKWIIYHNLIYDTAATINDNPNHDTAKETVTDWKSRLNVESIEVLEVLYSLHVQGIIGSRLI